MVWCQMKTQGCEENWERNALHLDLRTFLSCKIRGIELEREGGGGKGRTDRQTERQPCLGWSFEPSYDTPSPPTKEQAFKNMSPWAILIQPPEPLSSFSQFQWSFVHIITVPLLSFDLSFSKVRCLFPCWFLLNSLVLWHSLFSFISLRQCDCFPSCKSLLVSNSLIHFL